MQNEPTLDPLGLRPLIQFVETDPAGPSAGCLFDCRPRAEGVHAPLPHAALGDPRDPIWGQSSPTPGGDVTEQALKLYAVLLAPRPQKEPLSLQTEALR